MRIGMICPYSLSLPGGVQNQVLSLTRALRRRGHEARVLAPCDGPPPELFVTPLGKSLPTAANGSIAPIAPDPSAQLRTIRALWDEGFDVLHVHEPLAPGPSHTALLVKPAPVVGTFHAAGSMPAYHAVSALANWGAHRIDVRVVVSDDALALAQRHLPGSYRALFNGIEVDRFRSADPWPTDGPTVFFLGRHEPRKGLEVLLAALPDLPDDVRVWVAGSGPETASLTARYHDHRIEWLGRISDEERDRRLAGADVFCAPSLGGESFGVILLEAMAAGTTVVATSIPGYAKVAVVDGAPAAILVEPDDPAALATGIRRALTDTDLTAALHAEGDRRADSFNMERLCDAYLDLYAEAIERAPHDRSPRRPWWSGSGFFGGTRNR
ncbi:MAG: glycosyltransferase family 4 protein [Actinomycetes bacterium]